MYGPAEAMLGMNVIRRAGQLLLAILQFANKQQRWFYHVFQSIILGFLGCADSLFASPKW